MSGSDSDDAPIVPSDSTITTALRGAVSACFEKDNLDDLTVKRIRASVVAELRLANDFFKSNKRWDGKSKDIITKEVEVCEARREEQEASEALPGKVPSESPPRVKAAKSSKSTKAAPVKPAPSKRKKSTTTTKGKKAHKRVSSSDVSELTEDEDVTVPSSPASPVSEDEDESPAKKPSRKEAPKKSASATSPKQIPNEAAKKTLMAVEAHGAESDFDDIKTQPTKRKSLDSANTSNKRRKQTVISDEEDEVTQHSSDEDEGATTISRNDARRDSPNDESRATTAPSPTNKPRLDAQDSESEMSIVHDSPPPAKKKRQKAEPKPSTTKTTATKTTTTDSTLSPAEEETKRLQSHLIKCGVRKVWVKEFASAHCSTSAQKNAHLKRLLADVGMSGRFSEEKAKRIKEEREFNKDLEETKELAAKWGGSQVGSGSDDEGGDSTKRRPKRKLARGLKELEMFEGDEESD